jgi:gliding motility-associated-like protein
MTRTLIFAALLCLSVAGCKRKDQALTCPATNEYLKGSIGSRKFVLPNAFTPNRDGKNDRLMVLASDSALVRSMEFKITDAGGNLLYTLTKSSPVWYGVDANNKVYATGKYGVDYTIVLNDSAGNPVTQQGHTCISVLSDYDTVIVGSQVRNCIKAPESFLNYYLEDMFDLKTLETPYTSGENFCR